MCLLTSPWGCLGTDSIPASPVYVTAKHILLPSLCSLQVDMNYEWESFTLSLGEFKMFPNFRNRDTLWSFLLTNHKCNLHYLFLS